MQLLNFFESFKYSKDKDYSGVLPFNKVNGTVLLNLRSVLVNNPLVYSSWGGGIEENETAEDAAVREFKEEAGIDINIDSLIYVHTAFKRKSDWTKQYYLFLIPMEKQLKPKLNEESDGFLWITLDSLYKMKKKKFHPEFYTTIQSIKNDLYKYIS